MELFLEVNPHFLDGIRNDKGASEIVSKKIRQLDRPNRNSLYISSVLSWLRPNRLVLTGPAHMNDTVETFLMRNATDLVDFVLGVDLQGIFAISKSDGSKLAQLVQKFLRRRSIFRRSKIRFSRTFTKAVERKIRHSLGYSSEFLKSRS